MSTGTSRGRATRGRSRLRPRTPAVRAAPIAPARLRVGVPSAECADQGREGPQGQGEQHRDREGSDEKRKPGHEPVSGDPTGRENRRRMGAQQELVEGSVLEVLAKEAIEGKEGGEEGGDPERPRGDGGKGGGRRTRPEREHGGHEDEEHDRGGRFARPAKSRPDVPVNDGGERSPRAFSRGQGGSPAPVRGRGAGGS